MSAVEEAWRPVVGMEATYEVSDRGGVRSVDRVIATKRGPRHIHSRPLAVATDAAGRRSVCLWRDGEKVHRRVHILVLEAFVGSRPDGLVGCHNDGDASNNTPANLRWDTYSANNYDLVKHGVHRNSRRTHCKKGHPFDGDNLVFDSVGYRACRTCRNATFRSSKARSRAREKAVRSEVAA